jgi:hypothetical protein
MMEIENFSLDQKADAENMVENIDDCLSSLGAYGTSEANDLYEELLTKRRILINRSYPEQWAQARADYNDDRVQPRYAGFPSNSPPLVAPTNSSTYTGAKRGRKKGDELVRVDTEDAKRLGQKVKQAREQVTKYLGRMSELQQWLTEMAYEDDYDQDSDEEQSSEMMQGRRELNEEIARVEDNLMQLYERRRADRSSNGSNGDPKMMAFAAGLDKSSNKPYFISTSSCSHEMERDIHFGIQIILKRSGADTQNKLKLKKGRMSGQARPMEWDGDLYQIPAQPSSSSGGNVDDDGSKVRRLN